MAAAIKQCWPNGVVDKFATGESYFHDVRLRLERDLRNLRGASLLWQTEEEEISARWDDDQNDEPLPSDQWQSYHVFFLAPDRQEFHFEDETAGMEEPEDPEQDTRTETAYPGEGWIGCAVGICLAAPYAVINLCSYSRYEDGTMSIPDVGQPYGCAPARRRRTHMTTRSLAEFHIAWRAVSAPEEGCVTIRATPTRSKKTNRCKVLA